MGQSQEAGGNDALDPLRRRQENDEHTTSRVAASARIATLAPTVTLLPPFVAPVSLDSPVIHLPAGRSKRIADSAIAMATARARQFDDLPSPPLIRLCSLQLPSLRAARLSRDSARSTL